MSISAQHPYTLMMGGSKVAVLGVQCAVKGKKAGHLITFQPGTSLAEEDSKGGVKVLNITLDGQIHETEWMPYGEAGTLAYYGKTEQERWAFLQLLMSSKTLAVEFKPFLTGLPVTAAFTLGNLRDEVLKHTECAGH